MSTITAAEYPIYAMVRQNLYEYCLLTKSLLEKTSFTLSWHKKGNHSICIGCPVRTTRI